MSDTFDHPSPPYNLTLPPHVDTPEKDGHTRRKNALATMKKNFTNSSLQVELDGENLRWEPVYSPAQVVAQSFGHYRRLGEGETKMTKFVKLVNLGEHPMTELTLLGRNVLRFLLFTIGENWAKGLCLPDSIAAIYTNEVGEFRVGTQLPKDRVGYVGEVGGYVREIREYVREEAERLRSLVQQMCDKSGVDLVIPSDVDHFLKELECHMNPFNAVILNHPCLWSPLRFEGFFDTLKNRWSEKNESEEKNVLTTALISLPSDCLLEIDGSWKKAFEQNLPTKLGSREVYIDQLNSKWTKESSDFKQLDILFFIRNMMVHGHMSEYGRLLLGLEEIVRVFKCTFPNYILELPRQIWLADENNVFEDLWEH